MFQFSGTPSCTRHLEERSEVSSRLRHASAGLQGNIETPWSTKLPCSRKPPQAKINEFTPVKHSRHSSSLLHQKQPLGLLTLFLRMFWPLFLGEAGLRARTKQAKSNMHPRTSSSPTIGTTPKQKSSCTLHVQVPFKLKRVQMIFVADTFLTFLGRGESQRGIYVGMYLLTYTQNSQTHHTVPCGSCGQFPWLHSTPPGPAFRRLVLASEGLWFGWTGTNPKILQNWG